MKLVSGLLFFASTRVSKFIVVFRKLMNDLDTPFGFYSGDCFDSVGVLFNSRTCICVYSMCLRVSRYVYIAFVIGFVLSFISLLSLKKKKTRITDMP